MWINNEDVNRKPITIVPAGNHAMSGLTVSTVAPIVIAAALVACFIGASAIDWIATLAISFTFDSR